MIHLNLLKLSTEYRLQPFYETQYTVYVVDNWVCYYLGVGASICLVERRRWNSTGRVVDCRVVDVFQPLQGNVRTTVAQTHHSDVEHRLRTERLHRAVSSYPPWRQVADRQAVGGLDANERQQCSNHVWISWHECRHVRQYWLHRWAHRPHTDSGPTNECSNGGIGRK